MHLLHLSTLIVAPGLVAASSILLSGGTIVAFNHSSQALEVIRDGSLLITDDRIAGIFTDNTTEVPEGTDTVDVKGKIITPGFIDTHKHGWQTAFKTLGSNTSLIEYFGRYGEFASAKLNYTPEDVYIGQIAGIYEALNAGVTTILDHAHHTWSNATSKAGLDASIDSGARIFWAFAFHQIEEKNYLIPEQLAFYRELAANRSFAGSPTEIGVAYDTFDPNNATEVNAIITLALETNASVITTHSLGGPWGIENSPEIFADFGILNISIPIVFSHASFLSEEGAALLRETNQYISITPESEFHYGHTHPRSHLIQDQAALGIDTHFTFSSDILTQARLWLQSVRRLLYAAVLNHNEVPVNNPQSAAQAFLLATRHGGLALRRDDLGVISVGAKADVVVWDGDSPSLLGWNDPVAAVILHASVADIEHVIVDGKWKKKDFKLTVEDYPEIKERFLASAARIQTQLILDTASTQLPGPPATWPPSGLPFAFTNVSDTLRGDGNGYGELFLETLE